MAILDSPTVTCMKLDSLKRSHLEGLCADWGIATSGTKSDLIEKVIAADVPTNEIDAAIRALYVQQANEDLRGLSRAQLAAELSQVSSYEWPCTQGQLDGYIQRNFTRQYLRYSEVVQAAQSKLSSAVIQYTICSWYNTWSTWLIEDVISRHGNVVPTLKNVKGVDIFFRGQPFDLKTTVIPDEFYNRFDSLQREPATLAKWYYENQGAQRFGADNRMFVVVHDAQSPQDSWKLKRNIDLIRRKLNSALSREEISDQDLVVFSFNNRTYRAHAKVIFVINEGEERQTSYR